MYWFAEVFTPHYIQNSENTGQTMLAGKLMILNAQFDPCRRVNIFGRRNLP